MASEVAEVARRDFAQQVEIDNDPRCITIFSFSGSFLSQDCETYPPPAPLPTLDLYRGG